MSSFTVFRGVKDGFPKKSTTAKLGSLTGDKVYLKVTASGVCGTDLHYVSTQLRPSLKSGA